MQAPDQLTETNRWQPDRDPDYSGELRQAASSPLYRHAAPASAERVPIQSYPAPTLPPPTLLMRNNSAPTPVQPYSDGIWLRPNRRPAARWSANVAVQLAALTVALVLLTIFLPHQWFILTICWIVLIVAAIKLALRWANHQPMRLSAALVEAIRDILRFTGQALVAMSQRRRRW